MLGGDHIEGFFLDAVPAFAVYVGSSASGRFGRYAYTFPVHEPLARAILQPFATVFVPKIEECLRRAVAAGEAAEGPVRPPLGAWFAYHVGALAAFLLTPAPPAVEFGAPRARLVGQAAWFALRGLGLHEEAIRRHYLPEALAALGGPVSPP